MLFIKKGVVAQNELFTYCAAPLFFIRPAAMVHKYPNQQPFLTRYANIFLSGSRPHSQYNTFLEMFHVKQSLKTYGTSWIEGCLHNYKLLYIQHYVVFSLHSRDVF
jgi:hypothetical protein